MESAQGQCHCCRAGLNQKCRYESNDKVNGQGHMYKGRKVYVFYLEFHGCFHKFKAYKKESKAKEEKGSVFRGLAIAEANEQKSTNAKYWICNNVHIQFEAYCCDKPIIYSCSQICSQYDPQCIFHAENTSTNKCEYHQRNHGTALKNAGYYCACGYSTYACFSHAL